MEKTKFNKHTDILRPILLIIILLLLSLRITWAHGDAYGVSVGDSDSLYSFGNSDFSYKTNYDYSYRNVERNDGERETEYKTGLRSNYYYAPAYSGRETCRRNDRNYIYCGR